MAHTNGPWKAEHYLVVADRVTRSRRFAIADTFTPAALSDSEKEANAHLIAAAPDLLEACRQAYEYLNTRNLGTSAINLKDVLERAITKAEAENRNLFQHRRIRATESLPR